MSLSFLHTGLARASVLFSLIIGVYGLWLFYRKQGVNGNYLGIMAVGEILYVAQIAIGTWLYLLGSRPGREVHILYGVLLILCLPAAYAYLRGKDDRREALFYGTLGLFLAGVSLRAIMTAVAQ